MTSLPPCQIDVLQVSALKDEGWQISPRNRQTQINDSALHPALLEKYRAAGLHLVFAQKPSFVVMEIEKERTPSNSDLGLRAAPDVLEDAFALGPGHHVCAEHLRENEI